MEVVRAWMALLVLLLWLGAANTASAADVSAELPLANPVTIESLATEQEPDVACGATTCLSVWTATDGRLRSARVDSNGILLDARASLISDRAGYAAVTWTGASYLVVYSADTGSGYVVRGRFVSEAGAIGPVVDIASSTPSLREVAAASLGGTTLVAWRASDPNEGTSELRGARVSADGSVLDPTGLNIGIGPGASIDPAVAASGSQFLVTWTDARNGTFDIYGARVTSGGAVLDGGGAPISNAAGDQTGSSVAAGSDGFMVSWTDTRSGDKDVYVARVTANFTVLDPAGVKISQNTGVDEVAGGLTHDGTSYLLAWDLPLSNGTVGTVVLTSLNDQAVPTTSNPVLNSGTGANTPRIARRGNGSALVWRDNSVGPSVMLRRLDAQRAPIDAQPITLSNGVEAHERPAISYDGTNYLVAWFERRATGTTGMVRAARVAPDGTMLDPGGITLASDVQLPPGSSTVRHLVSASKGGTHLVVWQTAGDIRARRVGTDGSILDADPISVAVSGVEEKEPAVAADGAGNFLVAYTRVGSTSDVVGTRISSSGAVLDPGGLSIATSAAGSEARPAVTFADGVYHVVHYFPASGLIRHNRVSTLGTVFPFVQAPGSGHGPPMIAAASDHLLIGSTRPDGWVDAARFNFSGASLGSFVLLGQAFLRSAEVVNSGGQWVVLLPHGSDTQVAYFAGDLSVQARDEYAGLEEPAIVAGPAGTVGLASSRVAGEAPYLGARRAFMRTVRRIAVSATVTQNATVEGDVVTFRVTITPASSTTVTVDYTIKNGSATAGSDYQATSGTLTFPPGTTDRLVNVPTIDDALDEEDNETLFLQLESATGAHVDDQFGTHRTSGFATIGDNDPSPTVSVADLSVEEGAGTAAVKVQLSSAGDRTARVFLTRWGGTAVPDEDYTFALASTEVTFSPGETEKTVNIPIIGDAVDEPDEFFDLRLGGAQALTISDEFARVTIVDDDPTPGLSVAPVSVVEGDSLTTSVQVSVGLTNPSSQTVTAKLATSDGTATAPGDYSAVTNRTITFSPGQTTQTTSLTVIADSVDELDEKFGVVLSDPLNATLSAATADVTIVDDDGPALTVGDASAAEGASLSFPISLSAPTVQDVAGSCATSNATATAGTDYTTRSAGFAIPAGATATSFSVDTLADTLDELDETVTLICTVGSAADLSDGQATGTVVDDDAAPTMSVTAPSAALEGDGVPHQVNLAVRLSAASGRPVTAKLSTADGSAAAPDDFTALSGVDVSFAAGETEKQVPLTIAGDFADEVDEALTATLSNVDGAGLPVPGATYTILDDDGPTVTVAGASVVEGNAGTAQLPFQINLSATSPQTVTGACTTADGTATPGADYTARSGSFSVPVGSTQGTFAVDVLGDTADEADETVALACTVDRSGELGDGQATGTITDDDEPPLPTVGALDASVVEGQSAAVRLVLSAASAGSVTVRARTVGGTAAAPADFVAIDKVVTFAPGATTTTIEVLTVNDGMAEGAESFQLELLQPSGATVARSARVTLSDTGKTPPDVAIGAGAIRLDRRGRAAVSLTCPAAPSVPKCTGLLTLTTATKVSVGRKRRAVMLGRSTFSIPRGRSVKVVVRLSKSSLELVRKLKSVRVVIAAGKVRRTVLLRAR
jgi:hypothetical protein